MRQKFLQNFNEDILNLIKGSGIAFTIRIVGIILLYILTLIITNKYGSEVYGEYAFFVLSVKLISLLAIAGVDTFLLRYISKNPEAKNMYTLSNRGTVAVVINATIISALIYFIGYKYFNYLFSDFKFIILLLICLLPFSILKVNTASHRALKQAMSFSVFEYLAIPFFTILAIISLGYCRESNMNPSLAYALSVVLAFLISIFFWQFKKGNNFLKKFFSYLKYTPEINKKALPFLVAGSVLFIGQWTVSLILKYYEGNQSLANFDAALKIGYLLMMPLTAGSIIAAPLFSRKFSLGDQAGNRQITKLITNSVFIITLPLIILIFIFSDQLMALYGPDFAASGNILKIIAIGLFFNSLTGPVAMLLQMTENQKIVQNVFLISTLFNIILSIFLIPQMGIEGAAWSHVAFQFVVNGILLIIVYNKFGYLSFGK